MASEYSLHVACAQTSPVSFVAREKETTRVRKRDDPRGEITDGSTQARKGAGVTHPQC